MKGFLTVTVTTLLWAVSGRAGELPLVFDKPFVGCFVGYAEARDFQFAIGGKGSSELFFMKGRDERLSTTGCTLHIYYVVEEREKGKEKWSGRMMAEDGFETSHGATVTPEVGKPITFIATYTGGTKVEISHVFSKEGVEFRTKVLENKPGNEVRAGVKILVGDMYRHLNAELTERELKQKINDGRIEVWPVGKPDSSGVKIDLHETEVNLQEQFPKGATRFSLESDRIADHEYTLTTADERFGIIEFKQARQLHHGFYLSWWPDPAKVAEQECRLLLTVK